MVADAEKQSAITDSAPEWTTDTMSSEGRPIFMRWLLSTLCNYKCSYCLQDHRRGGKHYKLRRIRSLAGVSKYVGIRSRNKNHAFDNFPPRDWLRAFEKLAPNPLVLNITGGEPFLDRANFGEVLRSLSGMEHVRVILIDTNGAWKAKNFASIDWTKIYMSVSYHPQMVTQERFLEQIREKVDLGIQIGMVNFVVEPNQASYYLDTRDKLASMGVFANACVYQGPDRQNERSLELYRRFIPPFDLKMKYFHERPKGKLCNFPAVAYSVSPPGLVDVACLGGGLRDFLAHDLPPRPDGAVKCPSDACVCLYMYAFLAESNRGRRFNLLMEYVDECRKHHRVQSGMSVPKEIQYSRNECLPME